MRASPRARSPSRLASTVNPLFGKQTEAQPDSVDEEPVVAATDGGIIEAGDEGEVLDESNESDGRPEDCDCAPCLGDLLCWPCYRDGFEEPNPSADDE